MVRLNFKAQPSRLQVVMLVPVMVAQCLPVFMRKSTIKPTLQLEFSTGFWSFCIMITLIPMLLANLFLQIMIVPPPKIANVTLEVSFLQGVFYLPSVHICCWDLWF